MSAPGPAQRGDREQCAAAALMVRPAAFGANPETAASNAFQQAGAPDPRLTDRARAESDALAARLAGAGVQVITLEDTAGPAKPDACFPNNWLGLHHGGVLATYPLLAPSRRPERRPNEVAALLESLGYPVRRRLDLTGWEAQGAFLEGTGSVVFDHSAGIAYACRSPRTDERPLAECCAALGYSPCAFDATGPAGEPVYHTNVVMSVGERFALACLEAVAAPDRARLRDSLAADRELLEIDRAGMNAFAGNLLQLATAGGGRVIALSATAFAALPPALRRRLERHGELLPVAVPTIERFGGGSVRCMLAEVFLPRAAARR